MKRIQFYRSILSSSVLTLVCLLLISVGCGNDSSSSGGIAGKAAVKTETPTPKVSDDKSPEARLEKYTGLINSGKYAEAQQMISSADGQYFSSRYSSVETFSGMMDTGSSMYANDSQCHPRSDKSTGFKVNESAINGAKAAVNYSVNCTGSKGTGNDTMMLVQENGSWMIYYPDPSP